MESAAAAARAERNAVVFKLITEQQLWESVKDKVLALVRLDVERAVDMLVKSLEYVPVAHSTLAPSPSHAEPA